MRRFDETQRLQNKLPATLLQSIRNMDDAVQKALSFLSDCSKCYLVDHEAFMQSHSTPSEDGQEVEPQPTLTKRSSSMLNLKQPLSNRLQKDGGNCLTNLFKKLAGGRFAAGASGSRQRLEQSIDTFCINLDLFLQQSLALNTSQQCAQEYREQCLIYVYQLTVRLLSSFRRYLGPLQLQKRLMTSTRLPMLLWMLQLSDQRKATFSHWAPLPCIPIRPVRLVDIEPESRDEDASSKTAETCDNRPPFLRRSAIRWISRHPVDRRFDSRLLHSSGEHPDKSVPAERAMRLMNQFRRLAPSVGKLPEQLENRLHSQLTATYPWIAQSVLQSFADYKADAEKHTASINQVKNIASVQRQLSSSVELAIKDDITEIDIPVSPRPPAAGAEELTSASDLSDGGEDYLPEAKLEKSEAHAEEKVLLNDPNADGFMICIGDDFVVGAVVDGSGAGAHARLAANLALAELFDLLINDGSSTINTITTTKSTVGNVLATTHDTMNLLERALSRAHRLLVDVEEAGATTLIFYILTAIRTDGTDGLAQQDKRLSSPAVRRMIDSSSSSTKTAELPFVLNYIIAGDIEGFWYDAKRERWDSLHQPVLMDESLRLNASVTPGGIGHWHGDKDEINGTFLWPDFNGKDQSRSNNIHFGQVLLGKSDLLLFSTDGLGDTLDPVQLFPRPNLIHGLEEFTAWQQFSERMGHEGAVMARKMKQQALHNILLPVIHPFGAEDRVDITQHAR